MDGRNDHPGNPAPLQRSVAVVGAGIAGLSCARLLRDHGRRVVVFDRGRGPGGRLSTRRVPSADGHATFDHGAPFFTASADSFRAAVQGWMGAGVCALWNARPATWSGGHLQPDPSRAVHVGVPGMSAICRHLAVALFVRRETTVTDLRRDDEGWRVERDGPHGEHDAEGPFATVVVAAAPPQSEALIASHARGIAERLGTMKTCTTWIGMIKLDAPLTHLPDLIEIDDDAALRRIIRDDAKPGRTGDGGSRWVLHARRAWSAARYDAPRAEVVQALLEAARPVLGGPCAPLDKHVTFSAAHRWGCAEIVRGIDQPCLFDARSALAVCGDGFAGSGVEAAFLSGAAAARQALAAPRTDLKEARRA